jgi:hypothetical protein
MRVNLIFLVLLAVLSGFVAGCGDSDDSTSSSGGSKSASTEADSGDEDAATEEQHLDGTVKLAGTLFQLTPAGRAPMTFELGEDVSKAEIQALATAGATARVTFLPAHGEASPIAISVHEVAPHEGADTAEGTVTKVDEDSITIATSGGAKTYPLSESVAAEVDHLREHMAEGEPLRLFLDKDGGTLTVIAYEDA